MQKFNSKIMVPETLQMHSLSEINKKNIKSTNNNNTNTNNNKY